jgi:TRAP transporter TAXI family solute receptor
VALQSSQKGKRRPKGIKNLKSIRRREVEKMFKWKRAKHVNNRGIVCIAIGTLALSVCLFFCMALSADAQIPKKDYLMGSTSTTSSYYPPAVAIAQILNKYVPEMRVTLVETGATHDNLKRMKKGQLDFATITCPDGIVMAYYGTFLYKGDPWPKYRILNYFYTTQEYHVVRADSEIKSIRELEGKKFHLGIPGSATEYNSRVIFTKLNLKPNLVVGSLGDALSMAKDNRIVGFVKSSPPKILDSMIADLKTLTPISILSFTEEELKIALNAVPGIVRIDVPVGGITGAPDLGPITTWGKLGGTVLTSEIPEEVGYKMIKALVENWADLCAVHKEASYYDPIKSTIKWNVSFATPVPLHAGVVRYFKEKGFDVPASIIPPEYKR